jgi:methionyl-tRNA formyltransferase
MSIYGDKPSIVFFGSGPVAAASLDLLLQSFGIEAVVTKPRPAHHKGAVPVLELASSLELPIITAANKSELSEQIASAQFQSQVAVLIDFGIIVARDVIEKFPLGIINSHFSLLPEWRGADPITFAILSGQQTTGVSLMLLVETMDEGPLLAQIPYKIEPHETTPSLTEALIELSYESLREIVPLYLSGEAVATPQELITMASNPTPTYSRKLTKNDGILDLTKSAGALEREIRAYLEWPKSRTTIAGKDVIITGARAAQAAIANPDNKTSFVSDSQICLQTCDGVLVIDSLKPAGKGSMSAAAFLAGYGRNL